MPTDKQRLEKLARRMTWTRRFCDGTRCAYETNMPCEIYGFKHPEGDTLHPDDFRAWIDAIPDLDLKPSLGPIPEDTQDEPNQGWN